MRHIHKGREPQSLNTYKQAGDTQYEDGSLDKAPIQQQLIAEQYGLCAYCMDRISANPGRTPRMIIEHILCRENHSHYQLEYKNMLGVCLGGKNNPAMQPHCDQYKDRSTGSGVIHYKIKKLHPLHANVESLYYFSGNGKMLAINKDADVEADIAGLNLNETTVRKNREMIIEDLKNKYFKVKDKGNKGDVRRFLNQEIRKWDTPNRRGLLPSYNLVAIKFLEKRLARLN